MQHVLTIVAPRELGVLTPASIARARDAVGGLAPVILSPGEAADIPCPAPPDLDAARRALGGGFFDLLATRGPARVKRLLVADMDSTIVTSETLDDLAAIAGIGDRVAEITRRSMAGEVDFGAALRERVALLRGLGLDAIETVARGIALTDGARTLVATMRAAGARTALISGGFTVFTSVAVRLCGFDEQHANVLLDDGHALTGAIAEPILDREAKRRILERLAQEGGLGMEETLAVGDGANDLAMLARAGLGVAFRAKPVVTRQIANRVDHGDLRALLFAQGIPASAFRDD